MAHHFLKYVVIAIFLVIFFIFALAFLDTLVDERKIIVTPSIPKKKAIFTALASTKISASAQTVFNVLLDFPNYGKWNTHTPEFKWDAVTPDGAPLPGTQGKVKVQLAGRAPIMSTVQFTMIDKQRRMMSSKESAYPDWLLKAERVYEVSSIRKDLCEFRTWETFGGLMGFLVKYVTFASVEESGNRCADNLRIYVENVQSSDSLLYH